MSRFDRDINKPKANFTHIEPVDKSAGKHIEYLRPLSIELFSDENGNAQPDSLQEEKVQAIMASAEDIGIVQICLVRRLPDGRLQLLCGRHRREAAIRLRLLLPCEIIENVSDRRAYEIMAESNPPGREKFPSEMGKIFAKYLEWRNDSESKEKTAEKIAEKFCVSKRTVYRYAVIAALDPDIATLIDEKRISVKPIDSVAALSEEQQQSLAQYCCTHIIKTADMSALIESMKSFCLSADEAAQRLSESEQAASKQPKGQSEFLSAMKKRYKALANYDDDTLSQYICKLIEIDIEHKQVQQIGGSSEKL